MTIKLDQYMEERLRVLNAKLYPEEGDDMTIIIGMLISSHEKLSRIQEITR